MSAVQRTAPLAFWAIAQSFLNTLFGLFGPPEAVAFQHTHTSQQRALLLPWLRAGEALMRRLLLLEASAYPKPNTRPLLTRPRAKRTRRLVGFDDDKPETWRVSFRCLHSTLSGRSAAKSRGPFEQVTGTPETRTTMDAGSSRSALRPGNVELSRFEGDWFTAKPTKFYSAWPLAERYEALLRVFNNPASFAKRLAARLHANPHRGVELMRLPQCRKTDAPPSTRDMIGADFDPLDGACHRSLLRLNSS